MTPNKLPPLPDTEFDDRVAHIGRRRATAFFIPRLIVIGALIAIIWRACA